MITGERQAARIRSLYLKTIMRQDIAFFDKETSTGEVVGRMSGDIVLIQNAMGEKVLLPCAETMQLFVIYSVDHQIPHWIEAVMFPCAFYLPFCRLEI